MNDRPGLLEFSAGLAIFTFAMVLLVMSQVAPKAPPLDYAFYGSAFAVAALGAGLVLGILPEMVSGTARHIEDAALSFRRAYRKPVEPPENAGGVGNKVVIDQQNPLRGAWRDYWLAALDYAEKVGGVSFAKMKDFFAGDHATWRDCFVLPLVRQGYIFPIQPRVETMAAYPLPELTAKLEAWDLPPAPPYAPPAPFEQLGNTEKQPVNSISHVMEQETVYAKDVRP